MSDQRITVTRERWIERLREPGRKQTRGVLRGYDDPEAMCCLGHLCDEQDPDGWGYCSSDLWFMRGVPVAPNTLHPHRPDWMTVRQAFDAAELNDKYGKSLTEIADWVEAGMPPITEWLAS